MMKELKPRKTRFGAIISFYDPAIHTATDRENLESLANKSAFVYLHHVGSNGGNGSGLQWVGYKTRPKLKALIGHFLTKFQGLTLVGFISPKALLVSDAERLYDFVDANRMERAYAFHAGDPEKPEFIGVSSALMEHLFHAIPDSMEITEDWLTWIHNWVRKFMIGGRYFSADDKITLAITPPSTPEAPPTEPSIELLQAKSDEAAHWNLPQEPFEKAIAAKRKPGRPRKNPVA